MLDLTGFATRRFGALVITAATSAGCAFGSSSTISRSGAIGETFRGPGGLQVQAVRYLPHVAAGHDISGLATPRRGTHFVAFLIRECIATFDLPTLSQRNFTLALADGTNAALKFPETVFADDLDLLGEPGCERGHIVFEVPRSGRPAALSFALDWSKTNGRGSLRTTNLRFLWRL